jgi:hypothetical protein
MTSAAFAAPSASTTASGSTAATGKEDASMSSTHSAAASTSRTSRIAGYVLSGLAVLFLVFDGVIKLMLIDPVVQSMGELGYPVAMATRIGLLELVCVALYVFPRTSVLGAVLLTGYLGGAVASQARIESSLFGNVLFPTYVGLMIWGGLLLRDRQLWQLFPFRR